MLNGIYLSTAGARVEAIRQDVIANNLANVGTTGFRADHAVFRARLNEALEDGGVSRFEQHALLEALGGGVFLDEVTYSSRVGAVNPTENAFDFALGGDGFFALERGFYTRDGRFQRAPDGTLATLDGRFRVLDTKGKPIAIAPGELEVSRDGSVIQNGDVTAKMAVVGRVDPARFEKASGTRFRYIGEGEPSATKGGEVLQGFLENSGVSPVKEMVALVQSHRAYEMNMNMIRTQNETLQGAIRGIPGLAS